MQLGTKYKREMRLLRLNESQTQTLIKNPATLDRYSYGRRYFKPIKCCLR